MILVPCGWQGNRRGKAPLQLLWSAQVESTAMEQAAMWKDRMLQGDNRLLGSGLQALVLTVYTHKHVAAPQKCVHSVGFGGMLGRQCCVASSVGPTCSGRVSVPFQA